MPLVAERTTNKLPRTLKAGIILIVFGCLPLPISVIISMAMGDRNPNPIGPGLLFFFTAWPALILTVIGVIQLILRRKTQ